MSVRLAIAGISLAAVFAAGLPTFDRMGPMRAVAHTGHVFAAGEPGDPKKPFRVVEITMTDGPGTMSYSPDKIDVRKGEQIKFVLKNTGYLPHEFLLNSFENNAKHKIEMAEEP